MAYTTINKSTDYFNTKLYTGNGGTNAITGVGFQPDWVWIKNRNTTGWHNLLDVIRGTGKTIYSNRTDAEGNYPSALSSFDSDGFTVGNNGDTNGNGNGIVSWNWKANGTGSANTDGSINSTVSVNTTAGFSIVSYTGNGTAGATIGHGLGNVPKMIIIKQYSSNGGTENWGVYHQSLGNTDGLFLNTTGSTVGTNTFWNNTTPTSSVFTLGNSDVVNNNTVSYIAYCFAEKTGYSKFGKYTGNGNADGTFVYTGFKPAWVMFKKTNSATSADWQIQDAKRPSYNPLPYYLEANTSNAEVDWTSNFPLDFLSNGFKFRSSGSQANNSGDTYIYMAFGQSLVGSNNVPCTAR